MNRLKVVIDTNVLISGTFWSGPSANIIKLIEDNEIIFIITPKILAEYNEVMNYDEIKQKIKNHKECAEAVQKILQLGISLDPQEKLNAIKNDPDDNKFIEAAVAGKVDYLITKDEKHILPLKQFRGIKIVTPDEFLEYIEKLGWMMLGEKALKKLWDNEEDEKWSDP